MTNEAIEAQVVAPVENTGEVAQETQSVLGDNPVTTEATEVKADAAPAETVVSDNIDFLKTVGDDFKSLATQKGFNSVDDVMKSYSNLEGMMGKRMDELTADETRAVYTKLGAPEEISGYDFEKVELPGGTEDIMSDWFAEKSFELGLSKEAANNLRNSYVESQQEEYKQMAAQAQQQANDHIAELKTEFGAAFDERISLANTALNEFGGQEVKDLINNNGLSNHPALVKMLAEIGKITSEGKMVSDTSAESSQFGITPSDAKARIAEKFADPAFMTRWKNTADPQHNQAKEEIMALYKLKNGVAG